jgi:histidine triad (HIT) family protein
MAHDSLEIHDSLETRGLKSVGKQSSWENSCTGLTLPRGNTMPSIFSKIIDREIPAEIVFEDDLCLAFRDVNPKAPTHILVIPKKEIVSLADLTDEDEQIVGRCLMVVSKVAAQEQLSGGYRLVANCGDDGGQEVPHLHFHLLGGRKMTWPPG